MNYDMPVRFCLFVCCCWWWWWCVCVCGAGRGGGGGSVRAVRVCVEGGGAFVSIN